MFFEGLEVQYGQKIEENPFKIVMSVPEWAVLGDLGIMLLEVGLSWLMLELCWDIIGNKVAAKIVI